MTSRRTQNARVTRGHVDKRDAVSVPAVVNRDGSISFRGSKLTASGVFLEALVGEGANGFVVRGRHKFLSVPVAVKFWVSLRRKDTRDKHIQAVAEIKKLIEAEHYRSVVTWRAADLTAGYLYAVMDLVEGQTLRAWLGGARPLDIRWQLAVRLVDEVCGMAYSGLYHGDLHSKNIMIVDDTPRPANSAVKMFRIIDFGTSVFAFKRTSRSRHWRVFTETVDALISPFSVGAFGSDKTPIADPADVRDWYRARLEWIRRSLIWKGADWLIDGDELHESYKHEFANREAMLSNLLPIPPAASTLTDVLISRGLLRISKGELGSRFWSPLERSHYIDNRGIPGPPWSTSITDREWW